MVVWTFLLALGLPGCFYIGGDLHERELDGDADGVAWPDDCDPDDPLASLRQEWFADADGDGFGDAGTALEACGQPVGFVANADDCDDTRSAVSPEGTERCDGLGIDEDCDGLVDDADESPEGRTTFYVDSDGDGFGGTTTVQACEPPSNAVLTSGDCDDADASVRPGGVEVCGGTDEDCDGVEDDQDASVTGTQPFWVDNDGDGYGDPAGRVFRCTMGTGLVDDATDCDDDAADVNPAADEICDPGQVDENCNGVSNEDGATIAYYADADGDGYGDASDAVQACAQPPGFVPDATDCNDAHAGINPGATEVCDPADVDENCNQLSDDAENGPLIGPNYHPDADGDGFGDTDVAPVVYCDTVPSGLVADGSDCDDTLDVVNPTAAEVCDAIDNDCDGLIDDDDGNVSGRTEWYLDSDGDGFGAGIASFVLACTAPSSSYVADATDCNDADAGVNPAAAEVCGNGDDDCDGAADDADPQGASGTTTFYVDGDGDGFGAAAVQACVQPAGAVGDGSDCDDGNVLVHPGGIERCGGGDEDCDGSVDEADAADANTFYADTDSDGFGDPGAGTSTCAGTLAGHVADATDCDDSTGAVNPGASESCAPGDEDCDGLEDDDDTDPTGTSTFYFDSDGDGFGGPQAFQACVAPAGYVSVSTDCDDGNASVNPSGTEVCDPADVDEDCDGLADDASAAVASQLPYYLDTDGDGYGAPVIVGFACEPPAGHVSDNTDCNDGVPTANPGQPEVCDPGDVDNDCDGFADDLDPQGASGQLLYFADLDDDDFGDANDAGTLLCDPQNGEELDNTDCDDGDEDRNPDELEFHSDGVDSDCDGADVLCGGGYFEVPSGPFPTITSAIDTSCPDDIVLVAPGTYNENLDLLGHDIRLDAQNSSFRPIIDGGNNGPVIIVDGLSDIDDFVIQNGNGVDGGCIQIRGGNDVDITDSELLNCSTTGNGGAVHADAATSGSYLDNVIIDGATAVGSGGALYGEGRLWTDDTTISNSSSGVAGGAIAIGFDGDGLVTRSTFTNNSAPQGGAIACLSCNHYDFYNSTFTGNTATTGSGGAIYVETNTGGGHGDVDDNVFTGNSAAVDGGAMAYINTGFWNSDFDNDLFDSNSAGGRGGAVYFLGVYGTDLDDVVFDGNSADQGAAIYADDVLMDWDRTTVDSNTAVSGSAVDIVNSTTDFRAIDQITLLDNAGPAAAITVVSTAQMDVVGLDLDNPASGGNAYFQGPLDVTNLLSRADTAGPAVRMVSSGTDDGSLVNATIANQTAGTALEVEYLGAAACTVNNTIVVSSTTGIAVTGGGNVPTVTYSNLFGNGVDYAGMTDPGGTNLAVSPGFVGGGDFHLAGGSLLIDAGDPGISDPDASRSDLGTYGGPLAQ